MNTKIFAWWDLNRQAVNATAGALSCNHLELIELK